MERSIFTSLFNLGERLKKILNTLDLGGLKPLYIRDVSWHRGLDSLYSPLDIYVIEKGGVKTVDVYRELFIGVSTIDDPAYAWMLRSYGRTVGLEVLTLGSVEKEDLLQRLHRAGDIGIHVVDDVEEDPLLGIEAKPKNHVFLASREGALILLLGYIRPYASLVTGKPLLIMGPVVELDTPLEHPTLLGRDLKPVDRVEDSYYLGYPSEGGGFAEPLRSIAVFGDKS